MNSYPLEFLNQQADYEFVDWNYHSGTTEQEYNYLLDRIHEADFDVYIMDYQHLGVYTVF